MARYDRELILAKVSSKKIYFIPILVWLVSAIVDFSSNRFSLKVNVAYFIGGLILVLFTAMLVAGRENIFGVFVWNDFKKVNREKLDEGQNMLATIGMSLIIYAFISFLAKISI